MGSLELAPTPPPSSSTARKVLFSFSSSLLVFLFSETERRTVATLALAFRHSNHSVREHFLFGLLEESFGLCIFIIIKCLPMSVMSPIHHVLSKVCQESRLLTLRKVDLFLRSIERRLHMQFSMARKFLLRPLSRYAYDEKPDGKTA